MTFEFHYRRNEDLSSPANSLVNQCIFCLSHSDVWKYQRRKLKRLPDPLASKLIHSLLQRRLITPPLLELFQHCVQELDLENYPGLNASWFAYLSGFLYLKFLCLDNCKILSDAFLWNLSGLEYLESLHLNRCSSITNCGISHILSLKSLLDLQLSETSVGSTGVSKLSSLKKLVRLNVGGIPLNDSDFSELKTLKDLQHLEVWGSLLSNRILPLLSHFPSLQSLNMAWTNISCLPSLPSLLHLNLSNCTITHVFQYPPSLDSISPPLPSHPTPNAIFPSHPFSMQELIMTGCSFDGIGIFLNEMRLSNLKVLDVSGMNVGTNDLSFLRHVPNLIKLDLNSTNVNDDSMEILSKNCASLTWLDLSHTSVGSTGLSHLIGHLTQLVYLALKETKVSDDVFPLLPLFPLLQGINLKGTNVSGYLSQNGVDSPVLLNLSNLSYLRRIDLLKTKMTDDACRQLSKISSLHHLLLESEYISDGGLHTLGGLRNLHSLTLLCAFLTDIGLLLYHPPPSLLHFNIRGCWLLTLQGVMTFSERHPSLHVHHEKLVLEKFRVKASKKKASNYGSLQSNFQHSFLDNMNGGVSYYSNGGEEEEGDMYDEDDFSFDVMKMREEVRRKGKEKEKESTFFSENKFGVKMSQSLVSKSLVRSLDRSLAQKIDERIRYSKEQLQNLRNAPLSSLFPFDNLNCIPMDLKYIFGL